MKLYNAIQPGDDQKTNLIINPDHVIFIGKIPVQIQKPNYITSRMEVEVIQPPPDYKTLITNSNVLPALFITNDDAMRLEQKFPNRNTLTH